MAATRRFSAVRGQHDARSIRLRDCLDPMAGNLRIEQTGGAAKLSEA